MGNVSNWNEAFLLLGSSPDRFEEFFLDVSCALLECIRVEGYMDLSLMEVSTPSGAWRSSAANDLVARCRPWCGRSCVPFGG